jgi:hypothetical protein
MTSSTAHKPLSPKSLCQTGSPVETSRSVTDVLGSAQTSTRSSPTGQRQVICPFAATRVQDRTPLSEKPVTDKPTPRVS